MGKVTRKFRLESALLSMFAAVIVAFATQNAQAGTEYAVVASLQEQIEVAYRARNLPAIEAARRELLDIAANSADPAAGQAAYFAAYARFRLALAAEGDRDAARAYLDDCIDELGQLVQKRPADGEARALLGSCYGISTRYHRLGMASRGLAARSQMAAARELAPESPWVTLQDGLADYATPRLFGGDRELGITKLERAAQLFAEAREQGSRMAAWGAAETWQQLGQMYRDAGRLAEAAAAEERAGEALPDSQGPPERLVTL